MRMMILFVPQNLSSCAEARRTVNQATTIHVQSVHTRRRDWLGISEITYPASTLEDEVKGCFATLLGQS